MGFCTRRMLGGGHREVDMPITPMLDMTFQLLFFFILVYKPANDEGEINYILPAPEATSNDKNPATPVPSGDEAELQFKAEITVLVRTQHDGTNDGKVNEVRIVQETGDTAITIREKPNGEADFSELVEVLKKKRPDLINQDDLFIQGDSRLYWSGMVAVMDACRKAGFANVGFKAPGDI